MTAARPALTQPKPTQRYTSTGLSVLEYAATRSGQENLAQLLRTTLRHYDLREEEAPINDVQRYCSTQAARAAHDMLDTLTSNPNPLTGAERGYLEFLRSPWLWHPIIHAAKELDTTYYKLPLTTRKLQNVKA